MAVDPNSSVDSDCPARFTGSDHNRFDPVGVTVAPTAGDTEHDGVFQPWVCGTGATYVAWRIGRETGRLGVYDRARNRVWLGSTGYPAGSGRYYYFVDLRDANEDLRKQIWRGHASHQSPSAEACRGDIDEWKASGCITPRHPAPGDAAVVGDLHPFELGWWRGTSDGLFQPWRPVSGGAVYIAFFIDDSFAEFGVYDGHSVRFGRTGPLSGCYFAYPADDNTFDTIRRDIDSLYESVPDAGFQVI